MSERVRRESSPGAIEDDLSALWRDVGRDTAPVTRAMMANLVVYRDCPPEDAVDLSASIEGLPLDEVVERHPSRLILLHHGGRAALRVPRSPRLVGVVLFGGADARFGVEEIAVRSSCAESSLPSIVRRLALGDIPTSIWWTEDLSRSRRRSNALVMMGRQLLYDSRHWTRRPARSAGGRADRRESPRARRCGSELAPADAALSGADARRRVGVPASAERSARAGGCASGTRAAKRALAWLLAGWFSSRLAWSGFDARGR